MSPQTKNTPPGACRAICTPSSAKKTRARAEGDFTFTGKDAAFAKLQEMESK
jgi:hypothetical protein